MRGSAILLVLVSAASCHSAPESAYTSEAPAARNTTVAERLTKEAADLVASDPGRAEKMLREALANDLFFGPAHNNLGVLYLGRGELYEAASEFEWARKLMPGHPDPRLNLAITLERAGQDEDAFAAYTAALEVYPGYVPAIQGLAKLAVSSGREDERLAGWLETLTLEGETEAWREWARLEGLRR